MFKSFVSNFSMSLVAILMTCVFCASAEVSIEQKQLEQLFDELLDENLKSYTGASVAVVYKGETILLKGYGFQDAQRTVPVNTDKTMFRVASVTKTLVGVGIAQLIEENVITSLDDTANNYLKRVSLPKNRNEDITVRMLATHQAGFAEKRGAFQFDDDPIQLLSPEYVEDTIPNYIRPVNSGANYSNAGIGYLGVILSDQTGLEFEEFVAERIFNPTEMKSTIVPLSTTPPTNIAESQAFYGDGSTRIIPNNWNQNPLIRAGGGLITTANDMSRYMLALLGGSESEQVFDLLSESGKDIIFSRKGQNDDLSQGYSTVFMHNNWNGYDLYEHGGRTLGARSYLTLIPEIELGIFVTVTGEGGIDNPVFESLGIVKNPRVGPSYNPPYKPPTLSYLRAGYLEPILGKLAPSHEIVDIGNASLAQYTGEYISERRNDKSISNLFNSLLFGGTLNVTEDPDGGLRIGYAGQGYKPIGNDIFYRDPSLSETPAGWNDYFVFTRNKQGQVDEGYFYYTDAVFKKTSGINSPSNKMKLFSICFLLMLTGFFSFIWSKGFPFKKRFLVLASAMVLMPVIYLLFWRTSATEHLGYLTLSANRLIPYQLLTNIVFIIGLSIVVQAVFQFYRFKEHVATVRGKLAAVHIAILVPATLFLIISLFLLEQIGWNIN